MVFSGLSSLAQGNRKLFISLYRESDSEKQLLHLDTLCLDNIASAPTQILLIEDQSYILISTGESLLIFSYTSLTSPTLTSILAIQSIVSSPIIDLLYSQKMLFLLCKNFGVEGASLRALVKRGTTKKGKTTDKGTNNQETNKCRIASCQGIDKI